MSSSSTPVSCAGYNQNTFYFISRNNADGNNDYHLNTLSGTNQTIFNSQPLSGINGFPPNNSNFMGLCSYAIKTSSMYLSFEGSNTINTNGSSNSSTMGNTTVYSIYQLQIFGNGTYQLAKTAIELYNSSIFSFVHTSDANNTNNLAYISTGTTTNSNNGTQQQASTTTLNLMSLDSPSTHNTSVNISGTGILAVGGSNSQNLYLIQSGSIQEYRLDTMDYSTTNIQSNINMANIKPGTTGQVLSAANQNNTSSSNEYISVYYQDTATIDIFNHDSSRSKYTRLPMINGYVSFSGSHPLLPTMTNTNNTSSNNNTGSAAVPTTTSGGRKSAITSIGGDSETTPSSSTTTNNHRSSSSSTATPLGNDLNSFSLHSRRKRGLSNDGNFVSSSDGAYIYCKANITTENGSLLPAAAVLTAANSPDQQPPYNIVSFSGNNNTSYSVSSMTGTGDSLISETSVPTVYPSSSGVDLGGGAIAGTVIGVVAFIAIVAGLLLYTKKRKSKRSSIGTKSRSLNAAPLSIQPDEFIKPYMMNRGMLTDYNNNDNSSSILQESKYIPDEYHDGTRPDIRPLSYTADTVDYAQLSSDELLKLEPDVEGPLFLFSGTYTSSADEKVTYLRDGYAIRTFDADDGNTHTIHYFSSANLDTFIRSVYTVLQSSKNSTNDSTPSKYIMKSERAIVLNRPTPNFNYQYIWITSPMIPEHSLYHLLFERKKWTFIDHHNSDYKIWSIYAILESIETLHRHKFVHLAIDLKAYYYDHELKATDWRLGNFGYAQPSSVFTSRNHLLIPTNHSSFTAPEIITQKAGNDLILEAADIWSLGCVIYTVATGGLLLFENDIQVKNLVTFNNDMKQHLKTSLRDNIENEIFKNILEQMLQVDPKERKTITEVLAYWDSVYNMEE